MHRSQERLRRKEEQVHAGRHVAVPGLGTGLALPTEVDRALAGAEDGVATGKHDVPDGRPAIIKYFVRGLRIVR
ncbi:MAG: hypothetical protein ABJD11_02260 [Gemmatimonadota bacterium]